MNLRDTINAAIAEFTENGFDSVARLEYWTRAIREAARNDLTPEAELTRLLRDSLQAVYTRSIEQGGILRLNPGVSKFTLERVKPVLRAALDRRIMASAQLIKLNRDAAIERTVQRFSGWATSIPVGGSDAVDKRTVQKDLRKPMTQLPFAERRVAIDQGHKFAANLSLTLAENSGAIAGEWHSHYRQAGYNYREDHKERDSKVFAVRGNWALEQGLMNKGDGYTDELTQPAEEPFCRCWYKWIYNLRSLPPDMLTRKGKEALEQARIQMKAS